MTGDGIEAAEQIGKPLFEDNAVGHVQLNRFILEGLGILTGLRTMTQSTESARVSKVWAMSSMSETSSTG